MGTVSQVTNAAFAVSHSAEMSLEKSGCRGKMDPDHTESQMGPGPDLVGLLESITSNTCFSNGCGEPSSPVSAICNPGTYVYQITGYSGSNSVYGPYATRFDIVCSDSFAAIIGEKGSIYSSSKNIMNPQGYTSVLVDGGCITDHIKIGGTDFGNAKYPATLSSCSCAPGLSFVGFGTLQCQSYYPSFSTMSIQCDVVCPKGTYFVSGNCLLCAQGISYTRS